MTTERKLKIFITFALVLVAVLATVVAAQANIMSQHIDEARLVRIHVPNDDANEWVEDIWGYDNVPGTVSGYHNVSITDLDCTYKYQCIVDVFTKTSGNGIRIRFQQSNFIPTPTPAPTDFPTPTP